ncbi:MAG TPA: peptide chain release factor N(5)-glutamine methyltransferase [Candidatus Saccharimonadales bacterium]|nr:peptide chain release factor N(5)-glutamine methyltransferase [Candidatus Saccharimonadales bacterium]
MQLRPAIQAAISQLEAAGIDQPRISAEVLAFHLLGIDRAYLFARPERELTVTEQSDYENFIARRASGEPLQYIIGHQEFWKRDFLVSPAVLIPRPETEHLIEAVLELVQHYTLGGARLKLIDVGTGSGAIAITLARELPQSELHAVDLSPAALDVARTNAARLGAHVRFAQSDVLADVARDGSFDFVVSNPPYVGLNEADKVQDVVKHYEPHMAVFAGDGGLDVIRRLIPQAGEALRPGGWLLMEIGYTQADAVMSLLGSWNNVHSVPDLAGIPRVIVAQKTVTNR